MKVKVNTLSPIHIGNGERMSRIEWLVENGKLKVYKFDRIVSAIEALQKQNAYLWFRSSENLATPSALRHFLEQFQLKVEPSYELEVNGRLEELRARSEIEEFIKTLGGPYVPGSELKGSIRHLIACTFFMDRPDEVISRVERIVRGDPGAINQEVSRAEKELEAMAFYPQGVRVPRERDNARNDLMRAVAVPDSEPLSYEYLILEIPKLLNSSRSLYPCEAIREGVDFEMEIKVSKNALEGLKEALKELGGRYALAEKFSSEETFWHFLMECSQKFYSKLLEKEIEYFKVIHPSSVAHLESLRSYLGKGVLLRLGKHEGLLSTTLLLIVKEKDRRIFDEFFKKTQHNARDNTNKTRRINSQGLTFGWVLLERL